MAGRNALIEAIDREGERRRQEILHKGREEADALILRARKEIAARESETLEALREELTRLRTRERNRGFLEAGGRRAVAENGILLEVFAWVKDRLPALRKSPGYPDAFQRMWKEGLAAAGIGRVSRRAGEADPVSGVVRVHPDDVSLLREEADRSGWRLIPDPGIPGGFRMELRGGKIVLANTLESRLEKGWPAWLPEIRRILLD
ncbi:MAG: hypothetical protein HY760_08185 [Nitrospirae bacterium]|nr:hypothetical protein [Nitrospirota bacterium]